VKGVSVVVTILLFVVSVALADHLKKAGAILSESKPAPSASTNALQANATFQAAKPPAFH
jgi:hypothetical protein